MPERRADRLSQITARARALAAPQARTQVSTRGEGSEDNPTTAELWLYGVVGGWWFGFDSETVADALRGLDVDQIQVRLHSPGGNAIEGIAIANLLRNHKADVTMVVDGLAASAASVIALAGDEIVMSPGSQMMIHDPWMLTVGNADDLRSDADFLDKQAVNYAEIYADQAGETTAESWRESMLADNGRGTWYTAKEAVAAGLADRVGTVTSSTPPPAAPAPDEDVDDDDEMAARAAWDLEVLVHPAARAVWRDSSPKPPTASADGSITTQEGSPAVATFSDEQLATMRQDLGLPEDADEATIVAALSEALEERAENTTSSSSTEVPEGMVLVEKDVWEQTRTGASQGAAARTQQLADHRDRVLDQAVADGKITPARRKEHWPAAWKADAEGTEALIAGLPKGLVPTEDIGHDQSTASADEADHPELDAFGATLGLPKEALRG